VHKLLRSAFVLASLSAISSAQTITETFGTGANAFTMDFVTIGNPNNAADTTGSPNPVGSVAYTYNLGKYEVSRDMINKANTAGGLGITLPNMTSYGGNGADRPATGISWYEAATYVNWLNTSTGGTAAYKFVGGTFQLWAPTDAGYNANNMFRNSNAKFWLPSTDEWYKGAYGSPGGTWYNFATGSDTNPTAVTGGTNAGTAVYSHTSATGPADITNAGGLSAYGTMAQSGNIHEWMETATDGINNSAAENRDWRGGRWTDGFSTNLNASSRFDSPPTDESATILGFRVASVPEPSALSLLAIGLGGLALVRRRRS
jgi:formylglycine-generating enzyme required for sulfatase activity